MALRLTLKPAERVIIGGALLRNGGSKSIKLMVENEVPVLRESNILRPADVQTPCQRIYLALQLIYTDEAKQESHIVMYRTLADQVREAAPSADKYIKPIDALVADGDYYEALKRARSLLEYEQELLTHAG